MNALSKALNNNFRKLIMDLENARFEDVPTYAPKAFNKAIEYYRQAQQKLADFEAPDEINENIEQALESLIKARTAAKTSEKLLSEVVEKRGEINKNEQVRYRAPEKLNEAERAYRQATELAEKGEFEPARKLATTALAHYRDAKFTALEGGLIKNLGSRLQYTRDWLEPEAHDKALYIISSLESDLRHAKADDLDASHLTAKIAIAGNKIDSRSLNHYLW